MDDIISCKSVVVCLNYAEYQPLFVMIVDRYAFTSFNSPYYPRGYFQQYSMHVHVSRSSASAPHTDLTTTYMLSSRYLAIIIPSTACRFLLPVPAGRSLSYNNYYTAKSVLLLTFNNIIKFWLSEFHNSISTSLNHR